MRIIHGQIQYLTCLLAATPIIILKAFPTTLVPFASIVNFSVLLGWLLVNNKESFLLLLLLAHSKIDLI